MAGLGATWTDAGLAVTEREERPVPDGWVRLTVAACGICGGDLHAWRDPARRRTGTVPGHEVAGWFEDRLYAVSPNVTCGLCEFCLSGRSNLCRRGGHGIGLGRDGGIAEYLDAPRRNLYRVDDVVSPVAASLTEPLAVCLRAVRHAQVDVDSRVLVVGAGTLGVLTLLLLRDRVAEVAVTTRYAHQRELVAGSGGTALGEEDWQEWARQARPDAVIETAGGSGDTVGIGISAVRRGGRVVVLGASGRVPVDVGRLMVKEVTLTGSFAYGSGPRGEEFAAAAGLLTRWPGELDRVQTHRFALREVEDAFRCAADKKGGAVKVTVTP